MELLTVLIFALALSLDGFGVGVAYGIRKIKLPLSSLLVINLTSVLAITISMFAGRVLADFIPVSYAQHLGGFILMLVGMWVLGQALRNKNQPEIKKTDNNKPVMQIRIRPFGLVIQVLTEPSAADMDHSGVISINEAGVLGLALAMDAFAAGFAVSVAGFRPWITPLFVGINQFILIKAGMLLGKNTSRRFFSKQFTILPGCILIALGIFKII